MLYLSKFLSFLEHRLNRTSWIKRLLYQQLIIVPSLMVHFFQNSRNLLSRLMYVFYSWHNVCFQKQKPSSQSIIYSCNLVESTWIPFAPGILCCWSWFTLWNIEHGSPLFKNLYGKFSMDAETEYPIIQTRYQVKETDHE